MSIFNQHDINKFYMKSVQSIMKNMHVPDIMIWYEHAYVSLVSVIDHHLGYGLKSDSLSLYNDDIVLDNIKGTKYSQKSETVWRNLLELDQILWFCTFHFGLMILMHSHIGKPIELGLCTVVLSFVTIGCESSSCTDILLSLSVLISCYDTVW